jgi:hypothetical protein
MRRALAPLCAAALACGLLAGDALAAGEYEGNARGIALTPREAGFRALLQSVPAPRPAADKRQGFRSGWQAIYLGGTAAKPLQAIALVYVYRSPDDAQRAWNRSCGPCPRGIVAEGIRMKYQLRSAQGERTLINVAQCRNVYVALVLSGDRQGPELAREAGAVVGSTFRKAAARGMTPCGAS